jgi:hypothetical protein
MAGFTFIGGGKSGGHTNGLHGVLRRLDEQHVAILGAVHDDTAARAGQVARTADGAVVLNAWGEELLEDFMGDTDGLPRREAGERGFELFNGHSPISVNEAHHLKLNLLLRKTCNRCGEARTPRCRVDRRS